jgi:hypothetical protein
MFLSAGCYPLTAEGFSCSLGVLSGGLGKSKFQFLIKKEIFLAVNFFLSNFWPLDLIRIRNLENAESGHYINADPKPWLSRAEII